MADDVDDLLRRAMKTLDDQVPSGYFEGLPERTLARLEGQMQQQGTDSDKATGVPPQQPGPEEDSGLHDIRSLASSTKARLSSRRSSQNMILPDEDILASSSAGWKAVALPEPAKMVSLPDVAELPRKQAVESLSSSSSAAGSVTPIGSRAKPQTKKGPMLAIAGIGLAAAAGAAIYVATGSKKDAAEPTVAMAPAPTTASDTARGAAAPSKDLPKATVEPIPDPQAQAPAPASNAPVALADSGSGAAPSGVAGGAAHEGTDGQGKIAEVEKPAAPPVAKIGKHKSATPGKTAVQPPTVDKTVPNKPAKEETKAKPADGKKGDKETEPSLDDLLKEAGVQDKKPEAKPKLAKKSLSSDDIKQGMSAVAAKAQACYAGQQGTAAVRLTVSPDGKVEKVKVTGAFAGTPVGACVEAAVRGATFPAWDGGPQSFGYSYLLSE